MMGTVRVNCSEGNKKFRNFPPAGKGENEVGCTAILGPVSTRSRFERATRSLATHVRSHRLLHCAHSLCSATLASLARSVHRLANSLRSLPRETVETF